MNVVPLSLLLIFELIQAGEYQREIAIWAFLTLKSYKAFE